MSRNNRQHKSNTVVFPEIHDVEVKLLEVAINYKKLASREFREEKEERTNQGEDGRTNEGQDNENATGEAAGNDEGQADGAAGDGGVPVAVAKKEDKKKCVDQQVYLESIEKTNFSCRGPHFPKFLKAACKYRFNTETVMLCFWTTHEWSLMSLTGSYDFTKEPIRENDFQEFDGDDFTFNMAASITERGAKIKQFKLELKNIDRNVLMHQFNIKIMYMYLDDMEMQVYDNSYAIFVSFL